MASPATYYTTVDLASLTFEPLAKLNSLYVAPLAQPLTVLTPPVELATSLGDGDEPFAYIRPIGRFADWLRGVEAWLLDECVRRKEEWFRKDIDDDALRHNFKSFFRDGGEFKVKVVPDEVAVFGVDKAPVGAEEATAGRHVRCVLDLSRICFGRQEFGAMWRLVQARLVDVPQCLIEDEDEEDARDEDDASPDEAPADADEHEFL